MTLPDCPHCDATATLEVVYTKQGETYCTCSCCGKQTRIDGKGRAVKVERRRVEFDVSGRQCFDP